MRGIYIGTSDIPPILERIRTSSGVNDLGKKCLEFFGGMNNARKMGLHLCR